MFCTDGSKGRAGGRWRANGRSHLSVQSSLQDRLRNERLFGCKGVYSASSNCMLIILRRTVGSTRSQCTMVFAVISALPWFVHIIGWSYLISGTSPVAFVFCPTQANLVRNLMWLLELLNLFDGLIVGTYFLKQDTESYSYSRPKSWKFVWRCSLSTDQSNSWIVHRQRKESAVVAILVLRLQNDEATIWQNNSQSQAAPHL